MKKQKVQILEVFPVTHNVKCFRTEKPDGYTFEPGQATEIFPDKEEWKDEGRPFTFTNQPEDPFLEFIIKEYPDHEGVTREIHTLNPGDHFLIDDVFGAIQYSGPGLFIAGGAGITPFISILRKLHRKDQMEHNSLIFANLTSADIILHDELQEMLGDRFTNVLSDESTDEYRSGFVTRELIVDHLKRTHEKVYLCGPPPMMEAVHKHLTELEVSDDSIVEEEF
jgi:ferredoxin-NADP reductase